MLLLPPRAGVPSISLTPVTVEPRTEEERANWLDCGLTAGTVLVAREVGARLAGVGAGCVPAGFEEAVGPATVGVGLLSGLVM